MSIRENIARVRENIAHAAAAAGVQADSILLVAASKMNGAEAVREAIAAGVDACGENRVQELVEKNALGAYAGAQKHFIGHLQKNKVKQVVGVVDLIQSVDSPELMELISRRAEGLGLVQDALLEINLLREDSKTGMDPALLKKCLESAVLCPGIRIRGLMAVPPFGLSEAENRAYFARMKQLFVDIGGKKYDNVSMDYLSLGMSGDYTAAIAEGSNMVRVGSAIFGARNYNL